MNCKQNEVWWKHLPNLICSHSIIPDKNSGLNVEINSITRLVIIIFLVFSVFDIKYALLFLCTKIVFVVVHKVAVVLRVIAFCCSIKTPFCYCICIVAQQIT